METGFELGLIDRNTLTDIKDRKREIETEIKRVKTTVIKPTDAVNAYLTDHGTKPVDNGIYLDNLLKRAELDYRVVQTLAPAAQPLSFKVSQQVEIEIKYEGYIQRQYREIDKFRNLERMKIPESFNYAGIHGLSNELKEKLEAVKPASLGQASRIDGMTPSAISVLMIALKVFDKHDSRTFMK
jgi:tRNA uridine 5-carboxymethylaminomethyl modification enzyme